NRKQVENGQVDREERHEAQQPVDPQPCRLPGRLRYENGAAQLAHRDLSQHQPLEEAEDDRRGARRLLPPAHDRLARRFAHAGDARLHLRADEAVAVGTLRVLRVHAAGRVGHDRDGAGRAAAQHLERERPPSARPYPLEETLDRAHGRPVHGDHHVAGLEPSARAPAGSRAVTTESIWVVFSSGVPTVPASAAKMTNASTAFIATPAHTTSSRSATGFWSKARAGSIGTALAPPSSSPAIPSS